MAELKSIIKQLEQQKAGIERALEALRQVEGVAEPVSAPAPASAPTPAPTRKAGAPAKRKGRITAEGRKRLAEAMKRRWAVKRTAAQAKKRGGK